MRRTLLFFLLILISTGSVLGQKNVDFDKEQGAKAAESVIQQMGLVDDKAMVNYINEVGQRLVSNLENNQFEYQFFLVDMVEPNAFALPGGYIYVSRGILTIMQNEDELAGVLGHEINHVHMRHSYKQAKKSIFPALLKVPGSLLGTVNEEFGNMINAPIDAAGRLGLASYGRKQESEADQLGAALAAKSGYDPAQLANILARISEEVEYFTGEEERFKYTDSHPFTPDRVSSINEQAKSLTIADVPHFVETSDDFARKFDGMYISDNPVQGVFVGNSFYQADIGIAFDIPDDWQGVSKPTYVGATDKDQKGQLLLGFADPSVSTSDYANAVVSKMKQNYGIQSYKLEEISFNEYRGHLFAIDEETRGERVNYTMAWFTDGMVTFQMICVGAKKFEKDFNASIKSFHKITQAEKDKVTGLVLRVVDTREGETLKQVGDRSGNRLQSGFIALINNVSEDASFKKGQTVKVGKVEKYVPQSN